MVVLVNSKFNNTLKLIWLNTYNFRFVTLLQNNLDTQDTTLCYIGGLNIISFSCRFCINQDSDLTRVPDFDTFIHK